jgi:signal peptidase I
MANELVAGQLNQRSRETLDYQTSADRLSSRVAPSRRIPWIALALSFLSAGVGHLYCGRIAKGLTLYFAWLLLPICIAVALSLPASTASLIFLLLLPVVIVVGVYLYAAIDAWRTASLIGPYSFRDYNRVAVYWMMIAAQIAFSMGMIAVVNGVAYEAFLIPSKSMSPTILKGDRVVANKILPEHNFPARGDLIAYLNPTSKGGKKFIGRVVATAGDEIKIDGERVFVNSEELERESVADENLKLLGDQAKGRVEYEVNSGRRYLVSLEQSSKVNDDDVVFEAKVPERHVFILGDNRNLSRDSRHFGSIHLGDIVGHVEYVYWPSGSWSRFGVADDRLP